MFSYLRKFRFSLPSIADGPIADKSTKHKQVKKDQEAAKEPHITYSKYVIRPPDGGYGWVVLFFAFYTHFVVDGILFSSGMLLDRIMRTYNVQWELGSFVWSATFGLHYLLGLFVMPKGKFLHFKKSLPPQESFKETFRIKSNNGRYKPNFDEDDEDKFTLKYVIIPPNGGYSWAVCFCAFYVQFVVDGILFSSGIFLEKIMYHYKISSAKASIVWSVSYGMHYFMGPVCSACIRAIGLRPTAVIGAIITTSALALAAANPPFWVLVILVGGIGGLGMCFLYMTTSGIATNYFTTLRIYALGIIGTGTGLGTLVFAHLSKYLSNNMTLAQSFLVLSFFSLIIIFMVLSYRPIKPVKIKFHKTSEGVLQEVTDSSDSSDEEEEEESEESNSQNKIEKNAKTKKRKGLWNPFSSVRRWFSSSKKRVGINSHRYNGRISTFPPRSKITTLRETIKEERVGSTTNVAIPSSVQPTGPKVGGVELPKELEEFVHDVFDMRELNNIHILAYCLSGGLGAAGFMVAYTYEAERNGHDSAGQDYATAVVALIGAMNMLWRLQLGFISEIPGIPYHFVYHISIILAGTVTALSTYYTSNFFKIVYAACFSFGQACFAVYRPAMLIEIVRSEKLSNVSGINLLFMGVLSIPAPPFAGYLRNMYETFDVAFWFSGCLILLSSLIFLPTTLIRVLQE